MRTLDVAVNLYHRYEQTEKVEHYYGLLAIYALCQAADELNSPWLLDYCGSILDAYPAEAGHYRFNFECYRAGGSGKAWLAMKGRYHGQEALLREYADKTLAAPRSADGIAKLPSAEADLIWIDVVAAVTPFMLFTGLLLEEPAYIDYGAEQCLRMVDALLDESCGLLHQSRGFRGEGLLSDDHWSRGNGWGYLGLAELAQHLPADSPHRPGAERRFRALTDALLPHQTRRGLWRQEIPEPLAWEESSGSGLIAYGLGVGLRCGLLVGEQYRTAFSRAVEGLLAHCVNRDFSTERSCPGCLCPGEGENRGTVQAYLTEQLPCSNEHHSFGAIMLALVEAHRNGMEVIEWNI